MSCRRGDEEQDIEPNGKGGTKLMENFKEYNIPISLPIECTIKRIIDGTNGGNPLTSVDCQVHCIGQLYFKKVKAVWALLCRDGLGNCTLWNTWMYERHAHESENLALVKVVMHGGTLMIVEEGVRELEKFCYRLQQHNKFSWPHDDPLAEWFRTSYGANRHDPEKCRSPHLRQVHKVVPPDVVEQGQDQNLILIEYFRFSHDGGRQNVLELVVRSLQFSPPDFHGQERGALGLQQHQQHHPPPIAPMPRRPALTSRNPAMGPRMD